MKGKDEEVNGQVEEGCPGPTRGTETQNSDISNFKQMWNLVYETSVTSNLIQLLLTLNALIITTMHYTERDCNLP